MGRVEGMGREGSRQVLCCVCLSCSGAMGQTIDSEMAVESGKNFPVGNAELRNTPSPHTPHAPPGNPRERSRYKMTSGQTFKWSLNGVKATVGDSTLLYFTKPGVYEATDVTKRIL